MISNSPGRVFVVGGGPAGLAAAIAARLKGFDVTVADADHPSIDKACGEGILPGGVDALRRLGIPLSAEDGFPFRGIRFLSGSDSIDAVFREAPGLALRRTHLHDLLVRRAGELGVRLFWNTNIRTSSELPEADWIVGADGQQSRVRRETKLDAGRVISRRLGFRRHYQIAPWTDMVEVYWGTSYQIYVTPVSPTEIGVALLCRDPHLRLDSALCGFPQLQRRLRSGVPTSSERGAITVSRHLRQVFRGGTVLVGDASGSVDAITGDGLSLSFLQAHALADSLAASDLQAYQAEHRLLARNPELLARGLLLLDRSALLRHLVFRGLAWRPAMFSLLLAKYAPGA